MVEGISRFCRNCLLVCCLLLAAASGVDCHRLAQHLRAPTTFVLPPSRCSARQLFLLQRRQQRYNFLTEKTVMALSSGPNDRERRPSPLMLAFEVLGKSTRWAVAGMVGLNLLIRRDAVMVNFTIGALINAFLAKILKRIIKEQRPDGATLEDHGMPSSHAMSLFYMTSFVMAALWRGMPSWWPSSSLGYGPTVTLLLAYVLTASYWRVHSGLHTSAQILAGSVGGTTMGLLSERLSHLHLNEWLGAILERYPHKQVPVPYIVSVMVVGALTVGSVERKISKLIRKLSADSNKNS